MFLLHFLNLIHIQETSYIPRREQTENLLQKTCVFITVGEPIKLTVHLQGSVKYKLLKGLIYFWNTVWASHQLLRNDIIIPLFYQLSKRKINQMHGSTLSSYRIIQFFGYTKKICLGVVYFFTWYLLFLCPYSVCFHSKL